MLSAHGADARVTEMVAAGPAGLLPLYERFQAVTLAHAYRNVFLLIAVFTGVGAMMGLLVRRPPAADGGSEPHHLMAR